MKRLNWAAVVLGLFLSGVISGQEAAEEQEKNEDLTVDVVVTPSRYEKPAGEVVREVEVVNKKEMDSKGDKTLSEVIADTPGVVSTRSGGYGGTTTVSIRGSKTEQVLVMIDGIKINDPMSTGGEAAAELISLPGVSRVEVLKGPASSLYGSDAEAGVINLISSRPRLGQGARLFFEGGSFTTYNEVLEGWFARPDYYISLSGGQFDTEGISAADSRKGNHERDAYHNTNFGIRGGGRPADWLELELVGRIINTNTEIDTLNMTTGLPEDDPNYEVSGQTLLAAGRAIIFTGALKHRLEYQYATHERVYDNAPDKLHPYDTDNSEYYGELRKAVYQAEFSPTTSDKLVLGAEWQDEAGSNEIKGESQWGPYDSELEKKSVYTQSAFALFDHHQSQFGVMAGGRGDNNESFGYHTTGEGGFYLQPFEWGPRLRAHAGTGFKSPSLDQLYGRSSWGVYGNQNLQPETSVSWEIGLEQALLDRRVLLSATWFDTYYKNMIIYALPIGPYENLGEARAPGWEAELRLKPVDSLEMKASYSFVDARDSESGEQLFRRWGERYTFGVDYCPVKQIEMSLWGVHRGSAPDQYSTTKLRLDPYTVVNFSTKWRPSDQLAVSFRVDNIFDQEYYEVYGYGVMPLTFYGGMSWELGTLASK